MNRQAWTSRSLKLWCTVAALSCGALAVSCALTNKKSTKNKPSGEKIGPSQKFSEDNLDTVGNVVDYANYCKQELGLGEASLSPWNCLEGTEIPVTIDGKQPDDVSYAAMQKSHGGCDLPSWLGEEPCSNYAFVQERQLTPDVKALLLCRMRSFTNPKTMAERKKTYEKSGDAADFRLLYQFDSIGIIWTNETSGKTCYFDYVGASYGGYVASPDDTKPPTWDQLPSPKPPKAYEKDTSYWQKSAAETWKTPAEVAEKDNCVRCHDAGPFKSSPWISQVYKVPSNNQALPHLVVGKAFDTWKERFPMRTISTQPVTNKEGKTEPQICTSCHRIGSQATCKQFVGFSTGKGSPVELSDRGKSFFYRTWMPPSPEDWHGKLEGELTSLWTDAYEKHVGRLLCCCDNPDAKGCSTQRLDESPLPEAELGKGPGICP